MARKTHSIGPFSLALIDDAPVDLLHAVLTFREGENEPTLQFPQLQDNDQDRKPIIEAILKLGHDDLRPLERRCWRIRRLAEGKGSSSLNTVAAQQLDAEEHAEYENQVDSLCRSIWAYLNIRRTFEDAESFYLARQFRDYGKLYDAFEIELDEEVPTNAASINEAALAVKITEKLDLKTRCVVRALDLPGSASHPPSIMLIVRHGGPLSSVFDHRDDGQRRTIYYRPSNEATLIYTPAIRRLEICAESPFVRQTIAACLAEVALHHDVSKKPLTWRHYDLSRFRSSLTLPVPELEGFELLEAKVLEIELRLGSWKRKLSLKVTIDDDIDGVADRYLGRNSVIRRAEDFSRVGIAIRYHPIGDDRERTLNITVSGSNSCNLQSNKDPDQRSLGYALLQAWQIMTSFKQIGVAELHAIFPQLIQLFDQAEEEVTGSFLRGGLLPVRKTPS